MPDRRHMAGMLMLTSLNPTFSRVHNLKKPSEVGSEAASR
jgi:hypothetical protein